MKKFLTILAVLMVSHGLVCAAPSGIDPGVQGQSTREQMKQLQIEQKFVQPAMQKTPDIDQTYKMELQKNLDLQDGRVFNPQFHLNKINFEGNTVIKTKKLDKLAKEIEGQDIYFSDLIDFTAKVSRFYQKKGYLTSYASVPEQQIKDGIVTIYIKESRIGSRVIEGEKWANPWYVEHVLAGRKGIQEGDVFDSKALQAVLKEINMDNEYQSVTTSIKKNKDNDMTEIKLELPDRFPVTLDMNWDNYGRDITGRQRWTGILGSQNLTGFGDRIYGGTILSSGSRGAMAGYNIPISKYGTRLNYDFAYTDVSLGGGLRPLKIKGQSMSHFISISHPFIRNAKTDLIGRIGIDFVNTSSETELFGMKLSDYNLRVLRSSLYGMHDDKLGRWLGNLGCDFGFNGLGSSSGFAGGPQSEFVKVTAGGARVHRLPLDSIAIFRVSGQYSPNRLYPIEQMQIGGPFTLRGYQPAEIIGDYGVAGTFELRFPVPGLKQAQKILPEKMQVLDDRIKLAAFYDFGYIGNNSQMYSYPRNFLHSVGVGLHMYLTQFLSCQFGFGVPLGHKYYNEQSVRFYFGVSTEFDKLLPIKSKQKKIEVI